MSEWPRWVVAQPPGMCLAEPLPLWFSISLQPLCHEIRGEEPAHSGQQLGQSPHHPVHTSCRLWQDGDGWGEPCHTHSDYDGPTSAEPEGEGEATS